jgi:hypothetical protein
MLWHTASCSPLLDNSLILLDTPEVRAPKTNPMIFPTDYQKKNGRRGVGGKGKFEREKKKKQKTKEDKAGTTAS